MMRARNATGRPAAPAGTALAFDRVTRRFDGTPVVDGVSLTVSAGEIHAIVGLNGAGKTTLMRLALGMHTADAGGCSVLGRPLGSPGSHGSHGAHGAHGAPDWSEVGYLVETPFVYPELSARQNLTLVARLRGLEPRPARAAVETALTRFGLGAEAARRASALSLGNRQRLGLAGAFVRPSRLLVLDEPANALDPAGVLLVRAVLARAAEKGSGVLVSSHHLDEIARVAHRISVVHRGRIVGILQPGGVDLERRFFELVYAADAAGGATDGTSRTARDHVDGSG